MLDRCSALDFQIQQWAPRMRILMISSFAQLIILGVVPVLGISDLATLNANHNSTNISINSDAPLGDMSSSEYQSEISSLWSNLANISETASFLVTSENATLMQPLPGGNGTLDPLMQASNSTKAQNALAEDSYDNFLIITAITANIMIFVVGFCGNSLVILVISRYTKIESVTDIYILNLAFADLMFLFGLVFLIITMFIDHWIFGNLMCKLYMASTSLNQFASSLLLVVMSFDRYLAVCHPIYAQQFRQLRKAKIICSCIWIICLILMIPIFIFAKTNKEMTCAIFWPDHKIINCEIAFTLYSFALGFAVPLMLIAVFYLCVVRKLRVASKQPINLSSRRARNRETTNKRIEHLVVGIIFTYTICWLPYWLSQLLVSFGPTLEKSPIVGFYPFVLVATCLSYTNSALNPILYAFLSDNFKRRCWSVFRSMLTFKWCSSSGEESSNPRTTFHEASEVNSCPRLESKQTVIMNESVRLVTSSIQLNDNLTSQIEVDDEGHLRISSKNDHMGNNISDHVQTTRANNPTSGHHQHETSLVQYTPPPPPLLPNSLSLCENNGVDSNGTSRRTPSHSGGKRNVEFNIGTPPGSIASDPKKATLQISESRGQQHDAV